MADLDAPPAGPVEWTVSSTYRREIGSLTLSINGEEIDTTPAFYDSPTLAFAVGQTAWQAWQSACHLLPGSPPFGSCRVKRVGGGK